MKFWFVFVFSYVLSVECILASNSNWVQVNVPRWSSPGETVELTCDYDFGNDPLYSIKWYKDSSEFYRFVPGERPPGKVFRTDGIRVNMTMSDDKTVVLESISLKTSGLFTCEVCADAPSFYADHSQARMDVCDNDCKEHGNE
uniref:Ig-like domain-containing protein n=1 Tax=Photinus pyralis TaxID=7054 RepID=A0A1Y1N023_PHOPY